MNAALLTFPIGTPCPDRDRRLNDVLAELGYPSYPPITPPKAPVPMPGFPVTDDEE